MLVQLAEISWKKAKEILKKTDVAIIPVGSTEQHGPHNPLGTDYLVAEAVAKIVGEKTKVLVLPVVSVGVSEHHRHFPGSLWATTDIFKEYIKSTVLSVAIYGIKKIIFINGHGGNEGALMELASDLRRNYNIFAVYVMAFPPKVEEGHGHASFEETSINLYLHKHLVDMNESRDIEVKTTLGPFQIEGFNKIGPAKFAWDTIDLTDSGIFGPAGHSMITTTATAAAGREMMEPYIKEICNFVNKLKKADINDLITKPYSS